MSVSTEWLEKINADFREKDIPLEKRAWLALEMYAKNHGDILMGLGSTHSHEIFEWYKNKYKMETNRPNGSYQSVYYLDSEFWKVSIPIIYGSFAVQPFDCLSDMPKAIQDELFKNHQNSWQYYLYWADCFDYAYGYDQLLNSKNINSDGLSFFKAADQDLRKAITHYSNRIDNSAIVWDCRNALEKFMKSMIGFKVGISDKKAKGINHSLGKALAEFIDVTGYKNLEELGTDFNIYPDYANDRYDSINLDKASQWRCFALAQCIGALVVREFSDTNMLSRVLESAKRKQSNCSQ